MKLSTRSRYGARFMFELAKNYNNGPIYLKDIAKKQEISEKYLSKLVILLKNASLISSFRGSQGGYTLAKKPSEISMREIVEVLEGGIEIVDCINKDNFCKKIDGCVTRDVWIKLNSVIRDTLEKITLEDLVENHKKKNNAEVHNFII
ncbi:MAG: Rrf2 family transcriptional regulator [Melioribacter sp.]|uniref:RrF2 family transcriptional regulator n=1 Tax=Rosettibacter primus TaxID=3111523 RepID=UPI00247BB801|nr:Rrf2 family transcriptional regulator [Melioribacter sp.]